MSSPKSSAEHPPPPTPQAFPRPDLARGEGETRERRWGLAGIVEHRALLLAAMAVLAIVGGGLAHLAGEGATGDEIWRAAVASLALEQELAGVIVGLMFSGGAALEDIASTRARRELTALIQRAPKVAQRRVDERTERVPVNEVRAGDVVVVRTGEVVPVDGLLVAGEAVVDTSTLSGEPLPVTIASGMPVLSGTANAGSPFEVRADRAAAESAYAAL